MRLFHLIFLTVFLISPCAFADKRQELKRVEADLKAQEEARKNFAYQQNELEKKLKSVRSDLISLTDDIQKHERALTKVRAYHKETQSKIDVEHAKLEDKRGVLAQLILALQRLNRMPPQALLARPTTPIDTARSFELLQQVMPNVSAEAKEVKEILDDLAELQKTQDKQMADLAKEQKALQSKHTQLEKAVSRRRELIRETQRNQDRTAQKVASLAAQAKDLRELLDGIERQETPSNRALSSMGQTFKSWLGGAGKLPVSGTVKLGYGQSMPGGGVSKGLSIQATSGAIVTAPHDGVVRFAGPFRQYKLLIIIQHANGEHSLLGGLQELYTRTGDRIAAGEPLGKLSGDSTQSASLYYERRRNGKPIDPRSARG